MLHLLLIKDFAIKNASLLIDYSVLYDQAVRATLWNEVHLLYKVPAGVIHS